MATGGGLGVAGSGDGVDPSPDAVHAPSDNISPTITSRAPDLNVNGCAIACSWGVLL
jgi:hypothetical protein